MNSATTLAVALGALSALADAPVQAAPDVVSIPPGAYARFGGDFGFTPVGPVAGYWATECRVWHIRAQERRGQAPAAPEVGAALHRFVSGMIVEKPNYPELTPEMAKAVRQGLPPYWASINRLGEPTSVQRVDKDDVGNMIYEVEQKGGQTHWNIAVNPQGLIDQAFVCQGTGS